MDDLQWDQRMTTLSTDKNSGRQLSFTPKPTEAMVTFQERASEEALNEVLRAAPLLSVSQGFNGERGFAAVHVTLTRAWTLRRVWCKNGPRRPTLCR